MEKLYGQENGWAVLEQLFMCLSPSQHLFSKRHKKMRTGILRGCTLSSSGEPIMQALLFAQDSQCEN